MDLNNVSEILQVLRVIGFIDYGRKVDKDNRVIGSYLVMYMWEEEMKETLIRKNPNKGKPLYIKNILKNRFNKNNSKELGKDTSLKKEVSNDPSDRSDDSILPKKRRDLDISIEEEEIPMKNNRPTKESIDRPRRQGKYLPYGEASEAACRIVNDWNGLKSTVTHRLDSKAVERTLHWLDGEGDGKADFLDLQRMLRDLDEMLSNSETYDVPRGKMSMDDFFLGNDYTKRKPLYKRLLVVGGFKSFLKVEDRNPEITLELRKQYERGVLVESPDYSPKQEADFVKGASMLERYMRGKRLSKYIDHPGVDDYVHFMLEALADSFGASEITTGHLRSEFTFNSVLPRFLSKHFEE